MKQADIRLRIRKKIMILPLNPSYFKQRIFEIENLLMQNDEDIIESFIKSPFVFWQDKRHDNVPWNIDGVETIVDWNFHGFYDIKKITPADFKRVNYISFMENILGFIDSEIGSDKYAKEIPSVLKEIPDNAYSNYYILTITDKDKRHPYSIFDFFSSSLIVNTTNKTLTAIEIGGD